MKKRMITGTMMVLILLPIVLFPQLGLLCDILMMLFAIGAVLELLFMFDKVKKIPVATKIITVLLTLLLYHSIVYSLKDTILAVRGTDAVTPIVFTVVEFLHLEGVMCNPVFALIIMLIMLMATMVFDGKFEVGDLGRLYISIIYVAVCVSSFSVLKLFGTRFVVYLLLITIFTDVFAYVFGLTIGRKFNHKMAPNISPKKTWEGAIGGTATALIVGSLVLILYPKFASVFHGSAVSEFFDGVLNINKGSMAGKVIFYVLLTLFMSTCSQIGDLIASKLKRAHGIKDYSNLFPGHGGLLDRFDSAFFVSAVFMLFILIGISMFGA